MSKTFMKTHFLFFILTIFISLSSFCQTVNDIPIRDIDAEYIEIKGAPGEVFGRNIRVLIDFGQARRRISVKDQIIRDVDGKKMNFNSMIDALNFMSSNGYEFVQAYGVSISNKEIEHYYLLRKRKL